MLPLENKKVAVLGLGASGVAASELLRRKGASVLAFDDANTEGLQRDAERLRGQGVTVQLAGKPSPATGFDLAVASPGIPPGHPFLHSLRANGVPIIGEFELGYQHSLCLNIAIT